VTRSGAGDNVGGMVTRSDIELPDGRTLRGYDSGAPESGTGLTLLWHHGTPNIGAPPEPLFPAGARLGIRWVSYDRPGYGGSSPNPDRDVASAASDVAALADALGLDTFAVMGHSGGGPHALACAALLPDRVTAALSVAGMAPFDAEGLDWYGGMGDSCVESLRAAARGRETKEKYEAGDSGEPEFTDADNAALAGPWSWFLSVVNPAVAAGPAAQIDDDLAYVRPWGFDPARITAPVLLLHGGADRIVPAAHARWLAAHCRTAQLRVSPPDGHISILDSAPAALEWLAERSR
jgi:pimeloyl-ACP methyl ester carboxylesterase